MNKSDAGKKGGYIKWARIPKKGRADMMRAVARARWDNRSNETLP